jgi:hydrogenase maturation protease
VNDGDAGDPLGRQIRVLVLALGNVLLADDGLGADALTRVERDYRIPEGVRLEDGGTLGLALLGLIAESEHVILVDAVETGAPPGTLVRLDGADVLDAVRDRLSPHQVGVADLLNAARLIERYPSSVILLGLTPGDIGLAVVRSPAVSEGLEGLAAAVVREVRGLGYDMLRGAEPDGGHRAVHSLARHFGM